MITLLLILHGLLGVILIGAITHQAIAVWRSKPAPSKNFMQAVYNVRAGSYTNAIVLLYIITAVFGGIVYPIYVLDVKGSLTDAQMNSAVGAFELKEHFAIVGVAMLPTYWYLWKKVEHSEHRLSRALNTTVIAVMVWVSFLVGSILNNIKGLL